MFRNLFRSRRNRNKSARRGPAGKSFRPQLEVFEDRCVPTVVNWTLNGDGDFNNPNNWTDAANQSHHVPGPGDRANIPGNLTVTSTQDNSVDSVSAGAFRIMGGPSPSPTWSTAPASAT
jgi:hypothetical protein